MTKDRSLVRSLTRREAPQESVGAKGKGKGPKAELEKLLELRKEGRVLNLTYEAGSERLVLLLEGG